MVNVCVRLPAQQVLEYGLVTHHEYGLVVGTLVDSARPVFVSRRGRAFANSYTVHSSAPERRVKYRAVCASCSREVAFHAKLRREAVSCHGQFAAPRVTARRGDPIHFALVEKRVGALSLSECMQSLIALVPPGPTRPLSLPHPEEKECPRSAHPRGEANYRPVELRPPQLRLRWCQRESTVD